MTVNSSVTPQIWLLLSSDIKLKLSLDLIILCFFVNSTFENTSAFLMMEFSDRTSAVTVCLSLSQVCVSLPSSPSVLQSSCPTRIQRSHWCLRPHVPCWHCWLHHHRLRLLGLWSNIWLTSYLTQSLFSWIHSIWFSFYFYFPETLCSCWHHLLSLRRPSSWSFLGDGSDPIWYVYLSICLLASLSFPCLTVHLSVCRYHGDRQGSVFEEDSFGEAGLSGHFGFWDSLLDVLHPANSHWEVTELHLFHLHDVSDCHWLLSSI